MSQPLSDRQQGILRRVVEEYVATGQPVGSRSLVERSGLAVSASTVRGELADLERIGLLTHPHTSAGRMPTEAGYRLYVDGLLERQEPRSGEFSLDLPLARAEVEEALQATTEMLAQVTRLLALVSAPPLQAATVRHVEVLLLQPRIVMTVVITSLGGVTKLRTEFPGDVDPGFANWAADYLNDRLTGVRIGSRAVRLAFEEQGLSPRERLFLEAIRPSFDHAANEGRMLFVGGAAGLLDEMRQDEIGAYRSLMDALEKRAALLDVLAQRLDPRRAFARVGEELEQPGLKDLSLVGATYGFAHRTLGTVSLLGPLRMDYDKALRSVRSAARDLSRFVEDVYSEVSERRPTATSTECWASRGTPTMPRSRKPSAGWPASCIRTSRRRPTRRRGFARPPRPTRC